MFQGPTIYRNTLADQSASPKHWIGLQLKGDGRRCNAEGIGSVVRVTHLENGKPVTTMDEMQAMSGFGAQGDRRMHFGLGVSGAPVDIEVNWCGRLAGATRESSPTGMSSSQWVMNDQLYCVPLTVIDIL